MQPNLIHPLGHVNEQLAERRFATEANEKQTFVTQWFVCLFVFLALQPIAVVFSQPGSGP
jgi:hypothetical protein